MIYSVKRFSLLADGTGKSISAFKKQWESGGGEKSLGSFTDWYKGQNTGLNAANTQIAEKTAAQQAERAATMANPTLAAKKASQQGFQRGAKSVGMMGGIKNTFNKAGTMGKAGMIGGGLLATGLIAKGLFGGNKDKED